MNRATATNTPTLDEAVLDLRLSRNSEFRARLAQDPRGPGPAVFNLEWRSCSGTRRAIGFLPRRAAIALANYLLEMAKKPLWSHESRMTEANNSGEQP